MKIIKTVAEIKAALQSHRNEGQTIGLVPTMGYLHQGHLSLIRRAREACDIVVASIFVNPAQFGPQEDFQRYPKDLEKDAKLSEKEGVDYIFYPEASEIYPQEYTTYVEVIELSSKMCGRSRPGHFRGVTTVVLKLFNIIQPDIAFFGQKDAQQVIIISRMIKDLNLDVEIETLPIIREKDGLAMSSRNSYLNPQERKAAVVLYRSLKLAEKLIKGGERKASNLLHQIEQSITKEPLAKIDYISITDSKSLQELEFINNEVLIALAVFLGKTRLIDNILLRV